MINKWQENYAKNCVPTLSSPRSCVCCCRIVYLFLHCFFLSCLALAADMVPLWWRIRKIERQQRAESKARIKIQIITTDLCETETSMRSFASNWIRKRKRQSTQFASFLVPNDREGDSGTRLVDSMHEYHINIFHSFSLCRCWRPADYYTFTAKFPVENALVSVVDSVRVVSMRRCRLCTIADIRFVFILFQ